MAEICKTTLLLGIFYLLSAGQTEAFKLKDLDFAKKYLKEFHYLSPEKIGNHDVKIALELFQRYMHLPVTGKLDADTMKEMNKPRCGFPDIEEDDDTASPSGRKKRYAIAPTFWNKTSLTYAFVNYGSDMLTADYDRVIAKAFQMWEDESQLTFTKIQDAKIADIKLSFGRGKHGSCNYDFDGRQGSQQGNVLAHAFYPQDGDIHFDDDEQFTDGTYTGTNLLSVAVHEIGHVIGIGHSSEMNSVMYPQYSGYDPNLRLHSDDINAAAYLYGGGTVLPETTQSSCADRLPDCPKYKQYCTISSSTKIYCPVTCNGCPNKEQVASCVDKFSASLCLRYKTGGYCTSPYIQPNCMKSCNFCQS